MIPKSNGLVEIHSPNSNDKGFCCYQLGQYMIEESHDMDYSEYHQFRQERIKQAKNGVCHYRDKCPNYETSIKKMKDKIGVQLSFFDENLNNYENN